MERAIDGGTLRDNLTDIYGDGNRLVYLNDVLDVIDEQPTLTPPNERVSVEERLPEDDLPEGSNRLQIKVLVAIKAKNGYTVRTQNRIRQNPVLEQQRTLYGLVLEIFSLRWRAPSTTGRADIEAKCFDIQDRGQI